MNTTRDGLISGIAFVIMISGCATIKTSQREEQVEIRRYQTSYEDEGWAYGAKLDVVSDAAAERMGQANERDFHSGAGSVDGWVRAFCSRLSAME